MLLHVIIHHKQKIMHKGSTFINILPSFKAFLSSLLKFQKAGFVPRTKSPGVMTSHHIKNILMHDILHTHLCISLNTTSPQAQHMQIDNVMKSYFLVTIFCLP